jgi:hypothetical protein
MSMQHPNRFGCIMSHDYRYTASMSTTASPMSFVYSHVSSHSSNMRTTNPSPTAITGQSSSTCISSPRGGGGGWLHPEVTLQYAFWRRATEGMISGKVELREDVHHSVPCVSVELPLVYDHVDHIGDTGWRHRLPRVVAQPRRGPLVLGGSIMKLRSSAPTYAFWRRATEGMISGKAELREDVHHSVPCVSVELPLVYDHSITLGTLVGATDFHAWSPSHAVAHWFWGGSIRKLRSSAPTYAFWRRATEGMISGKAELREDIHHSVPCVSVELPLVYDHVDHIGDTGWRHRLPRVVAQPRRGPLVVVVQLTVDGQDHDTTVVGGHRDSGWTFGFTRTYRVFYISDFKQLHPNSNPKLRVLIILGIHNFGYKFR